MPARRPGHDMDATVRGSIYDYPRYYDLIFGSDCQAEFDFLRACFAKHALRRVRRLFEPACGTGRLLVKFAKRGYTVAGNDLNPKAVEFCNARFRRHGLKPAARLGDMSDFRVPKPYDAAFNTINTFRHLPTEAAAESHLRCMARALAPGGLYMLGLHLTPTKGRGDDQECWSARRGHLVVNSTMWTETLDLRRRMEYFGMTFDVYTPTQQFRIADRIEYRTYTAAQMRRLLGRVRALEHVATYDFAYDIDEPIAIDARTQDVVLVLRKR